MQYHFSLYSPSPLKPLSPTTTTRPRLAVSAAMVNRQQQPVSTSTMYELLSVTESAGPDEIKAAYRRQARRWHPDTCRSLEDKEFFAQQFMMAREAYRVLSDPVLREDYDYELNATSGSSSVHKAAAAAATSVFSMMRRGRLDRDGGVGDWEAQLEGLKGRSSSRAAAASTWGSRMRSVHKPRPSD